MRILCSVQAADAGTLLNPEHLRGPVEGGVAQAIGSASRGGADGRCGTVTTRTFRDCQLPQLGDLPPIEVRFPDAFHPLGPYGAKPMSETPNDPRRRRSRTPYATRLVRVPGSCRCPATGSGAFCIRDRRDAGTYDCPASSATSRTAMPPTILAVRRDLPAIADYLLIACRLAVLGARRCSVRDGAQRTACCVRGRPQPAMQPPVAAIWTTLFVESAIGGRRVHRWHREPIGPALSLYWVLSGLEALSLAVLMLGAPRFLTLSRGRQQPCVISRSGLYSPRGS